MKKLFFISALFFLSSTMTQAAVKIDRIEPECWYAGMKDTELQLMVYGKGIRDAEATVSYPNVKIDSLVRLDSPNYLLVYLNTAGAEPGSFDITFKLGKSSVKKRYELRARTMKGADRQGFTNADVLYMLMPDRFADGNPKNDVVKGMLDEVCNRQEPSMRHGGDLEGIRQHISYFKELGVTALWLTPVLENNGPAEDGKYSFYHGYATTNYYRVDPRFGTNNDYINLIKECHAAGLKVVMDMIFNHCGSSHPWAVDQPSHDWFNSPNYGLQTSYKLTPVFDPYASKIDKRETTDGWFVSSMPDLNQRNPHVMRYLTQNSIWWIETAGIDGIRMDTYPYADRDAMAGWMKTIDTEYPNFNTVGETWVTEPAYTAAWQKDSRLQKKNSYLKTVMDFALYDAVNSARGEETDDYWKGLNKIYNVLCYDYLYPNPKSVLAFIDNHDTDRFLGNTKDSTALRQALALLLTIKRTPQLYYGTEIMMNGTKEITDGYVRKDFPGGFPGDERNCFTKEGRTRAENNMFNWLSKLLHWRQGNDAIIKGSQTQFLPHNGIYVIARRYNGHTVMLLLNGKRTAVKPDMARYAEITGRHAEARDVITGQTVSLSNVSMEPRGTMILEF